MNKYQELVILNKKIQQLIKEKEVSWEVKYNLIFSKEIFRRIFDLFKELNLTFEYYDPDTSYEEDLTAFAFALEEKMQELSKIEYMFE
jgi:hypothetical protein